MGVNHTATKLMILDVGKLVLGRNKYSNNISVSFSFHPSSSKFPSWSGVPSSEDKSLGDDRGGGVSQIS